MVFRLIKYGFANARFNLFFFALFSLIAGLVPVISIYAISNAVRIVSQSGIGTDIYPYLMLLIISYLMNYALEPLSFLVQARMNEELAFKSLRTLMLAMGSSKNLNHLDDPKFLDRLSLVRSEILTRPSMVYLRGVYLFQNLVTIIVVSFSLVQILWWIPFLLILLFIPQVMFSAQLQEQIWNVVSGSEPRVRLLREYSNTLTTPEILPETKLFSAMPFFLEKFDLLLTQIKNERNKVRTRQSLGSFTLGIGSTFSVLLPLFFIVNFYSGNPAFVGVLVAYLQSIVVIQSNVGNFTQLFGYFTSDIKYMQSFFKLIDELTPDLPIKQSSDVSSSLKTFELVNIKYIYPNGTEALKNISLHMKIGQKIAIVGENGSGKTTLAKIILGIYRPTSGSILINDLKINDYNTDDASQIATTVFQTFAKYPLSLRENISLGQYDDQVEEIAHMLDVEAISKKLEKGLETQLGNFSGAAPLSGGQWQKVSLARSAVRSQQVQLMVFDEPTSALDAHNENVFYKVLDHISQNKLQIVITHRLASTISADVIVVMKNGAIFEIGCHNDLLQIPNGEYKKLWSEQAKYYNLEKSLSEPS